MTTVELGKEDSPSAAKGEPVLSVRHLSKHFPVRSSGLIRRKVGDVHRDEVDTLDLHQGLEPSGYGA